MVHTQWRRLLFFQRREVHLVLAADESLVYGMVMADQPDGATLWDYLCFEVPLTQGSRGAYRLAST